MDSANKLATDILRANSSHASALRKRKSLAGTPARRIAILTCMDVRIDPLGLAGLNLGDAHVIRNAGGRASDDAIRSLLVSYKFFGTRDWFVVQHTQCGMAGVTDQQIGELFTHSLEPASKRLDQWYHSETHCGSDHGLTTEWLTITNLEDSVRADVQTIAAHPLVSKSISVHGYVYDVQSGSLVMVENAFRPGTDLKTD